MGLLCVVQVPPNGDPTALPLAELSFKPDEHILYALKRTMQWSVGVVEKEYPAILADGQLNKGNVNKKAIELCRGFFATMYKHVVRIFDKGSKNDLPPDQVMKVSALF